MAEIVDRARSWIRRLWTADAAAPAHPGLAAACTGLEAVDAVERACGAERVTHGAGARADVAEAIGAALAGLRVSVSLRGPELVAVHDQLAWAAGRALPLVVYVRGEAGPGHALASGTGHEAWHAVADSGCVQLMATSHQDAADLALAARRIAEAALVPVILWLDGAEIAAAVGDAALPEPEAVRALLGEPGDELDAEGPWRHVFGERRRRVPRWVDLERPALHGALQGPDAWALGAAARSAYTEPHVAAVVRDVLVAVSALTGRPLAAVQAYGARDAAVALVVQGAATEIARTVAAQLGGALPIGVVAVRLLRPFPAADLLGALQNARHVGVVERLAAPLAGDPPLLRGVRRAVRGPTLHAITAGLGGYPLRATDLSVAAAGLVHGQRERVFLGLDLLPAHSPYPRHQAHLDALRRDHPELARLGLRTDAPAHPSPGTLTIAVAGPHGHPLGALLPRALFAALGGHVRSRPVTRDAAGWTRWSAAPFTDPGDQPPADVLVLVGPPGDRRPETLPPLRPDAAVILVAARRDAVRLLPAESARRLRDAATSRVDPGEAPEARAIGAVLSLLAARGHVAADRRLAEAAAALHLDLDALRAGPDALEPCELPGKSAAAAPVAPMAVRHLARDGSPTGVPQFWGTVGIHYRDGHPERVAPDPALAVGQVPPLTATFHDLAGTREVLPQLDPAACTGCGACWVACPEGALGVVSLTPRALVEAGVDLVGSSVGGALRPVIGKVDGAVAQALATGPADPTAGALLAPAVDAAIGGLAEARRPAVRAAADAVLAELSDLPVARTAPFWDSAERARRGGGELLSIVINPAACTGCGSCSAACAHEALHPAPQTPERVAAAHRNWQLWERLPDTAGATVTRCHELDEPGPLASALLPRVAQLAMAGGNDAEQGSGGKLNLRAVIGLTEAARQPALVAHLAEVARLKERVADAIRAEIAGALPVSDLDALASGLAAEGPAVEVGALLSHLGTPRAGATPGSGPASRAAPMEAAASARLRRLVLLARGLGELHERAAGERTGLPRARVGVVLDPALAAQWGVRFPHNPFQAPVVVAGAGALVPMAHGLLRGQIHETADGLALVHRAQLELDKPADAAKAGPPRARPWAELSAADRALCAPVLVVGTDALLDEPGLAELLDAGLPVKLLVLSELDLRAKGRELDLLARARRGAWAAQTSLGAPAHFARSVMIALAHDGPAILRAHAPSPTHHGFPTSDALARARGAVASRAWPLLRYDPAADGVFGTRVDLSGNPAKAVETPSAWAAGEARFSGADLAAADVERAATWALLQELSGALTPFTERVRAEVVAELGATHQAELARVRAEAEARVAAIEAETLARAARLVEDRLMRLAGYEAEEPA